MEANKKALVILNPKSGTKSKKGLIRQLEQNAEWVDFRFTEKPGHLTTIIEEEFDQYSIFIAAGGDGTVNEMAKKLYNTDKIMGIIPYGSGNGFARELGFKNKIPRLIKGIKKGKHLHIDVIHINEHPFVNMAGFGLDSYVAHLFQNLPKRGLLSYVKSTYKALKTFQPFKASIEYKKQKVEDDFLMVAIANTRQFGNNAKIAPNADPCDGIFDIVMVRKVPFYNYLQFGYQMFTGRLAKSKYVEFIPCQEKAVIQSSNEQFHIDGEPIFIQSPLTIELKPKALRVLNLKN